MNNKEVENWECSKCGFVGTAKREVVGQAISAVYDKKVEHSYREPNTPVEGIVCQRCRQHELI